jgi:hypothetical protein
VSGDPYIVCKDLSIQSVIEPDRPIGWELLEENDVWSFRITQVGFNPETCHIRQVGVDPNPPEGKKNVGSRVHMAYSREAMILDFEDDGEPEVTSKAPLECPGAPRKAPNPFIV